MGGLNEKREILTELDSNFSLLDGILHLDVAPHYVMLQNLQPAVANDIVRLEQSENSNGTTKKYRSKVGHSNLAPQTSRYPEVLYECSYY